MVTFSDPAEEATFAREGYVVRRVLDQQQTQATHRVIEDWTHRNYGTDFEGLPPQTAPRGVFSSEEVPDRTVREDLAEGLCSVVGAALRVGIRDGSPKYTGMILKKAHGAQLDLHLHPPMLPDPFARAVMFWCSLEDCDIADGCLFVIPRSHHLYRTIMIHDERPFFHHYAGKLAAKHARPVPVKAGEAIYFDNRLLHGSYPNLRSVSRLSVLGLMKRDGDDRAGYRRAADGQIEIIANRYGSNSLISDEPDGATNHPNIVLRRLPPWNRKATLAEVEVLLESELHPSEDFDPLEFLCGPEMPPEPQLPPMPTRNPILRGVARALPRAVKRPMRRFIDGWRSARAAGRSAPGG